ncbi:17365_t:CDS:1, partial [Racocetra fulgida]
DEHIKYHITKKYNLLNTNESFNLENEDTLDEELLEDLEDDIMKTIENIDKFNNNDEMKQLVNVVHNILKLQTI